MLKKRIGLGKQQSQRDFCLVMSLCRFQAVSDDYSEDRVVASTVLANPTISKLAKENKGHKHFNEIIAYHHIITSDNLDIFSHVTMSEHTPSWSPDWTNTSNLPAAQIRSMADMQSFSHLFNAGGCTVAKPALDGHKLILTGNQVDYIEAVGPALSWDARASLLHDIEKWMQIAGLDPSEEAAYTPMPSISKLEAFWQTLIMDINSRYGICGSPQRESGSWATRRKVCIDWRMDIERDDRGAGEPSSYGSNASSWSFHRLGQHLRTTTHGRVFAKTKQGWYGLVPDCASEGDEIWVMCGGNFPLILSPRDNGQHALKGIAYVHGIMDGEAIIQECQKVTLT
jgi:hypothetical protein